jgi:hypothetical protein
VVNTKNARIVIVFSIAAIREIGNDDCRCEVCRRRR